MLNKKSASLFSFYDIITHDKGAQTMGVGVDIEDIKRFEGKSQKFWDRIFTQNEQEYCLCKSIPASHLAVRFCAKEAVTKALNSMGIKQPALKEIEIYHNKNGCPQIRLPELNEYKDLKIEVSLSHDRTKAIAFVVINTKP